MRTNELIKSKFWRAADLQAMAPIVLTMVELTEEVMGRGSRDVKFVLWFREHLKGLQINKTRLKVLEAAYGPETDLWMGRKVRLSFDPTVEFGGRMVGGVKLETERGVVYTGSAHDAAWDSGPTPTSLPANAPPQAVWDGKTGQWVLPSPSPASAAPEPPKAVLNPQTGQWELPPQRYVPPPTISQRISQERPPPADAAFDQSTGEIPQPEFNDDIPF